MRLQPMAAHASFVPQARALVEYQRVASLRRSFSALTAVPVNSMRPKALELATDLTHPSVAPELHAAYLFSMSIDALFSKVAGREHRDSR